MPPENETSAPAKLPYPSGTGKPSLGYKDIQELAEKTNTFLKEYTLTLKEHTGAYEAKSGEFGTQNKTGETTTLPSAATASQLIGVYCFAANCKITTSGGAVFFGDFITSNPSTLTLTEKQHVLLLSNGTNWGIIAGEPKREETYGARTERTSNTEYEASATRPTFVIVEGSKLEATVEVFATVGGVTVGEVHVPGSAGGVITIATLSFIVPAAVKWKPVVNAGASIHSHYLTL